MNTSSMAMRLCTNSGNPVAISSPAATEAKREQLANHIARVAANSPSVPNSAGMIRQPHGLSPNTRMPSASSSLPSIGCSTLTGCDRAIRARAAGK